jgi:hypothetical protein
MTAPDHEIKPLENILRERGHPYMDTLHGGNPVHDDKNIELCKRERARIEAACRAAFNKLESQYIELDPSHFSM